MDPSTMDLPTTIEQTFNPAQVFNHDPTPPPPQPPTPPPPPHPDFSSTHPDYAELITAAITALKEREGSSRIAIAKYIDRVCTNLPPNHSALLTHHLKRLKNSGYLAMVKHSYILAAPGSVPPPAAEADSNGTDVSKRKPGRPPKLKAEAQPAQVQFQDQFQAQFQAQLQAQQQQAQFQPQFHTQPQFLQQQQPQYVTQPQFQFQPDPLLQNQLHFQPQQQPQGYGAPEAQNYSNLGAESVFVSLGLADGPVGVQNPSASVPPPAPADPSPAPETEASSTKRRPGRPRKDGSTVPKPVVPKSPVQSGAKRRPGRPAKTGTVDASPGSAVSPKPRGRPRKSSTPGRRGRPKKTVTAAAANVDANIPAGDPNATNIPADGGPIQTPKRRGRPPRSSNQGGAETVGVTDVPIAAAFDDSEAFPNTVGGVTNGAMPLGKRRGRPPKIYTSAAVAPTVKRPRKLSGRPLGRPKKNVTPPAVSDPKLVVAYEELKGKLDHMQSRIREATQALRPCLNAETPATALAAFQELEELAGPAAAAAGVDPLPQN